ncbi:MgtC/SapB family protein [Silvimonas sp.]|uniref:MgtC/SapB family protein n=1 Tax=Silvimonas sp. TaxID=2650811 RepID=UPI0028417E38|nr:MgtC/SapB family protein [Silvimonas sp.]MDR3428748.1 MgtC/SapB family protein [Silvimonas sp.]
MIANYDILVRLLAAAVLGGAIGFERERLSWSAGLRTHMLVCVGAALFMIVSAFGFSDVLQDAHTVLDPSRVAAQVVSGIGFLGAGSILMRGEVVKGLTTAASLWSVAAVGLACGGGLYFAAISAAIIILVILAGIKPLERMYREKAQRRELRIIASHAQLSPEMFNALLPKGTAKVKQFVLKPLELMETDEIIVTLSRVSPPEFEQIVAALKSLPAVRHMEERDIVGGL